MTKEVVKMAMKFDQAILEQRQQEAADKIINGYYRHSDVTGGSWVYPAIETHTFNGFDLALEFAEKMALLGRKRFPHSAPYNQGYFYSITYFKAQHEIDALVSESNQQVEEQYLAEIEAHNQAQTQLLAEQLYQAQKAKEDKLLKEKEEKAKQKALEEAEKFIQSQLKEGTK